MRPHRYAMAFILMAGHRAGLFTGSLKSILRYGSRQCRHRRPAGSGEIAGPPVMFQSRMRACVRDDIILKTFETAITVTLRRHESEAPAQ